MLPDPKPLTVTQALALIRGTLEEEPLQRLTVTGEISAWFVAGSGHIYFSLKDPGGLIKCALFRGPGRTVPAGLGNGVQVRVIGAATLYAPRGELQLRVSSLQLDGEGELHLALERLKRRLREEGLFDRPARPLPPYPTRVGIVTSPGGAVLHDIRTTLRRRNPTVRLVLAPSPVQGHGAEARLVEALERLGRLDHLDCVILARGGGSLEDLMAFNAEALVRAVAACPFPVISAIGHETDHSLCDAAADHRAPTPTAAAEMAAPRRSDLLEELDSHRGRLRRALQRRATEARGLLTGLRRAAPLHHPLKALLEPRQQLLDDLSVHLHRAARARRGLEARSLAELEQRLLGHHPGRRLREQGEELAGLRDRLSWLGRRITASRQEPLQALRTGLERGGRGWVRELERRLAALEGRLQALSPLRVLERGYAMVMDEGGRVLTRIDQTRGGQRIRLHLSDGAVGATLDPREEEDR